MTPEKGTGENIKKETGTPVKGATEEVVHVLMAEIPEDGFYREKIDAQWKKIQELEKNNNELIMALEEARSAINEREKRISKLERALIDATIK